MITENKINEIANYKIRVTKNKLPQSNKFLPGFFYSALFIGATGTGKTFKLVELLMLYKKYGIVDAKNNKMDIRICLFCSTAKSNANKVYELLKLNEEDIILKYNDDELENKLNEVKEEQQYIKEWNLYIEAYKKFHENDDENIDAMLDEELILLNKYGMNEQENLKRKPEKIYFFIFDDLLGTEAFKIRAKSKLNNLVTLCRHHNINLLFCTQYLKAIPPIIRSNSKVWCIFKCANSNLIIDHIYPELSSIIKEQIFKDAYEYSTQEDNNCLTIILGDMDKKYRIRKNWTVALEYN